MEALVHEDTAALRVNAYRIIMMDTAEDMLEILGVDSLMNSYIAIIRL